MHGFTWQFIIYNVHYVDIYVCNCNNERFIIDMKSASSVFIVLLYVNRIEIKM